MTPDQRLSFARCIRDLKSEADATKLLEAYEAQLEEDWPTELTELEQLPSWEHGALLERAMRAPPPTGYGDRYDASWLLFLREAQLIGLLSKAAEQALDRGEMLTASRVAQLLATAWTRLRGVEALAMALASEVEA